MDRWARSDPGIRSTHSFNRQIVLACTPGWNYPRAIAALTCMKPVLCLGSLNVDYTYRVPWLVRPGETLTAANVQRGAGGKGLNQSLALARAGATVAHVGGVGPEGAWLRELLAADGVNVDHIRCLKTGTGHAIIQVADSGENAIVLFAGANQALEAGQIAAAVRGVAAGGFFLTQNETNGVPEALQWAKEQGLTVVFNPAPMASAVRAYPLDCVDYLIVNETEAMELSGESAWETAAGQLARRYPKAVVVVTAGALGALALSQGRSLRVPAVRVQAVDTTAAGDVLVGYLVAGLAGGLGLEPALHRAAGAAALSVTRPGAAASIPLGADVEAFLARK